jgi:REP element-mobilizing transposase RayT
MARPLRLEFAGAIYHLTSRGNARQKVFFTDADRELFLMSTVQIVQAVQSFHSVQNVH